MNKFWGIAIILILITITCVGYCILDKFFPMAKPIKTPTLENIVSISITCNKEETVELLSTEFEKLVSNIKTAKPTRRMSVNDYPGIQKYYKIEIRTAEKEYSYFIYEEDNQVYIELPYDSIYTSTDKVLEWVSSF